MGSAAAYAEFLKTLGWVKYECERGGALVSERYYKHDVHEDLCYQTSVEELYPAFRHWLANRLGRSGGPTTAVPSAVEFRAGVQEVVARTRRNMQAWRSLNPGVWRRMPSNDNPFEMDSTYGHLVRVRPYCVREYEKFEREVVAAGLAPSVFADTASTVADETLTPVTPYLL